MSRQTPRRVGRAAARHRLGALIRIHDSRRRASIWVVLLGSAGLALLAAGYFYLIDSGPWIAAPSVALAMAYLGSAGWILGRAVLRGAVVFRYEHGFVRINPFQVYGWDEVTAVTVTAVQHSKRRRTAWRFMVERSDGRSTTLGAELPDLGDLGEAMVAEVTVRVVPAYQDVIAAGGSVGLGPFTIDPLGVSKDGELIPWAYVREVTMDNGVVAVHGPDDVVALAATVGRVPNAVALMALCRSVLRQKSVGHFQYP
ncbi:MAG TPA: DUF6585 family protein [Streptosporangiaceae bacterium]|nr:DUF6585 family protein [Streptosporangiaceae bacterium]